MDALLTEQMTPILRRIASALVEATPENWDSATLRVRMNEHAQGTIGLALEISSEVFPNELVWPTDEIFVAARELQQLCGGAGRPFSTLTFAVKRVGQDWEYGSDFEY
jgi:hypothetical protein